MLDACQRAAKLFPGNKFIRTSNMIMTHSYSIYNPEVKAKVNGHVRLGHPLKYGIGRARLLFRASRRRDAAWTAGADPCVTF